MDSSTFFLFLLCLGLGFASIFMANQLHKKYALSYLSALNYYVIAAVVYGILNWLGPVLVLRLLSGQPMAPLTLNLQVLLSLMAFPVLIVKIYFLLDLSRGIRGRSLAPAFRRGYAAFSLLLFLLYVFSVKYYFDSQSTAWMFGVIRGAGVLTVVAQFAALLALRWPVRSDSDEKRKLGQRRFGAVFLASFSLYALAAYFLNFGHAAWAVQAVPVVYFLVPLPPLLVLGGFLDKYYLEHPLLPVAVNELQRFFAHHNLSDREREIVGFVLKGATKIEMAEALFLSPHTVRNHLASVYKRLGVRNKVQLFYLVRNYFAANPAPPGPAALAGPGKQKRNQI